MKHKAIWIGFLVGLLYGILSFSFFVITNHYKMPFDYGFDGGEEIEGNIFLLIFFALAVYSLRIYSFLPSKYYMLFYFLPIITFSLIGALIGFIIQEIKERTTKS